MIVLIVQYDRKDHVEALVFDFSVIYSAIGLERYYLLEDECMKEPCGLRSDFHI